MSAPERHPGLTGTVLRGITFSGSGVILARGITLVTYIVLARLITPTELGDFTAGTFVVGIGVLFGGSGMAAAVIHRPDRLEEAAATAVVATSVSGLLLTGVAVATAPLIGLVFDSDTAAAVAAATAGVLFLNSARVIPNALLQRRFSFLRRIVVQPAAALAFGVVAIIATSEGMGVWGLVAGQYAYAVIDFVLSWTLVRWRPQLRLGSVPMWRELIRYGRHVLAGSLVRRVGDRVPILAAGSFVGTAALGQFQYANRIVTTSYTLLGAGASYVVFPAFARIADDAARLRAAFLRSLRWMALVAMGLGLLLIPLGEPLAILVFGERWAQAGEAIVALALFVPGRAIASVTGEGFKGAGVPAERTRASVVGVVVGILVMVALVPPFGLIGVAVGVTADALANGLYSIHRAHRAVGMPLGEMVRRIAEPLAAGIPMVLLLFALERLVVDAASWSTVPGLALLAAEAAFGMFVYGVALSAISPAAAHDFKRLVRSFRDRKGARRDTPEPVVETPEIQA
jgi:O-antigen/teichoic acid export membrane protein